MSPDELASMMKFLDRDNSGQVNYREMTRAFRAIPD
jgi:Ca2+-binding EF-hand superfamily protein